jgi:ribosome-binding protein aMBF1 (putative translation factor)
MNDIKILTEHRLNRGWSYARLAAEIGEVDPATIYRLIEQTPANPHKTTLRRVQRYLRRVKRARSNRRRRLYARHKRNRNTVTPALALRDRPGRSSDG